MGRVQDKVAIVTGGASGVGREDALLLAREGARVVITDVNVDAGQALAREIGDQALFVQHDIASEADWEAVIQTTTDRFGGVDILVANAGGPPPGGVDSTDLDAYRAMLLTQDKPGRADREKPVVKAPKPSRDEILALRSDVRKCEARVEKIEEMREKLATKLADPELYEDNRAGELATWNKKYAEVMDGLRRAETLWEQALEKLERAETA